MRKTYSGLVYAADQMFLEKGSQTHGLNGIRVEYNDIAARITSDLDIGDPSREDAVRRIRDAVWDTGAVKSIIAESTAREMGLQPIDNGIIVTATDQTEVPIYMVDVYMTKNLVIRNLKVFGSPMRNREIEFVIGMDIISRGKMIIDSMEGKTRFSFSIKEKD
ncbi:MAG: retroviral-like aspartic protease family protein [Eubacterium sp.]|nr:retroviral-like aspartic protease family protein [Eubacterium sp.]